MASVELSTTESQVHADEQRLLGPDPESSSRATQLDEISEASITRVKPQNGQSYSYIRRKRCILLTAFCVGFAVCCGLYVILSTQEASTSSTCISFSTTSVAPRGYNISFAFSDANFEADDAVADHSYAAQWAMRFDVVDSVAELNLHGVSFNITTVGLQPANAPYQCLCGPRCRSCDDVVVPGSTKEGCRDPQMLQIHLGGATLKGGQQAVLTMQYRGRFSSTSSGLYRSHNFSLGASSNVSEDREVLLVTQLETTSARLVFPCIDEPARKATFVVDITHPEYLTALTNTKPRLETILSDGRKHQHYEPSPIMSPYLLALCIGRLVSRSSRTDLGVIVNAWATPELGAQLALPLSLAVKALDFYTNWTGIMQPLQKFDLVAVPGKEGAMENWGLLLFDERRFLWNNETEGMHGQWLSADVICHEVAHQWFGNLVTCRDWNHLTLNEGMASFMEYLCLENIIAGSDARALAQRAPSIMGEGTGIHEGPHETALRADDQPLTSALIPDLSSLPRLEPSGALIYSKGASILRMLQSFLNASGSGSFQECVRAFLTRFAFETATIDDLVTYLLMHQDPTLAQRLLAWWYSPGFPALSVKAQNGKIALSQSRYLVWQSSVDSRPVVSWVIPILSHEGESGDMTWRLLTDTQHVIEEALPRAWQANYDGSGLYRTSYSSDLLDILLDASGPSVSIYAQASMMSDMFAFLLKGEGDADQVFRLLSDLRGNANASDPLTLHLVWGSVLDCMGDLRLAIRENDTCVEDFDAYVLELTEAAVNEALSILNSTMPAEAPLLVRLNQGTLLHVAALAGNHQAARFLCGMAFSKRAAFGWTDLTPAAYITAVAEAPACSLNEGTTSLDVWERMVLQWLDGDDVTMAEQGLLAAAYTRQVALTQLLLELILLGHQPPLRYRKTDAPPWRLVPSRARQADVLKIIMRNKAGAESVWDFISMNWIDIEARQEIWGLLELLPLLPSHTTLESVQAAADKHARSFSAARTRTLGSLQHRVEWADSFAHQICSRVAVQTFG